MEILGPPLLVKILEHRDSKYNINYDLNTAYRKAKKNLSIIPSEFPHPLFSEQRKAVCSSGPVT